MVELYQNGVNIPREDAGDDGYSAFSALDGSRATAARRTARGRRRR
jgi:hypothetical protein